MQIRKVFGFVGAVVIILTGCELSGDYVPPILRTPPEMSKAAKESMREYRRMGRIPKPDPRAEALWGTDLREALVRAKVNGKRVLVDFTNSDSGYVNVRWNYFYTQPKFLDLAEQQLELVKVDSAPTSGPSSESKKLNELFGIVNRPRYFILNAEGEIVWPKKDLFGRIKGVQTNLSGVNRTTVSDSVPQSVFYFEREKRFIERLELILDGREPSQGQAPVLSAQPVDGAVERLVRKRFSWAMQDGEFTDEGLAKVGRLFFSETDFQNTDFKGLSKYPQLNSLGFSGSPQATDEGIRELAKIKQIKKLNLSGPWITDCTLEELGKLTHLDEINVYQSQVTSEGVAKLKQALPGCKVHAGRPSSSSSRRKIKIILPSVPAILSDDERAELIRAAVGKAIGRPANQVTEADRQKPDELNLIFSKITDDCLKQIGALQQLKVLRLDNTRITDAGPTQLRNLSQLTHLGLSGTYVTDDGLQHLHHFKGLSSVTLGRTNVTPEGVAALKRALPKCDIHYYR